MKYTKGYVVIFYMLSINLQATPEPDIVQDESPYLDLSTRSYSDFLKYHAEKSLQNHEQTSHRFEDEKTENSLLNIEKDHSFPQDSTDTDNQFIKNSLQNLPAKNRPANINDALRLIAQGHKVFNLIKQGLIFDAISLNIDPSYHSSQPKSLDFVSFRMALTKAHDEQLFKFALNSDDATFWEQIKDDAVLKKSITSRKVPFTFTSLQSPEYNMFFKTTYIRKNMKNSNSLPAYIKAYQKTIIQLQWHLFAESIQQDQAFTSGMITFNDPNFKVFKCLDGFAELVSPKYKFYTGTDFHSIWADQAYTRESSHWTGQKAFENKNFGIDIKDNSDNPMSILPGNKSHILFGIRTNGMTFVKWEEYGTTFNVRAGDYSILHHTLRYFEKRNLEDDPKLERREKIPGSVIEKFQELYKKNLTKTEKQNIQTYGITQMLQLLEQDDPEKLAIFKNFLVQDMHYQPETLHLRKGGEIILPTQSFTQT